MKTTQNGKTAQKRAEQQIWAVRLLPYFLSELQSDSAQEPTERQRMHVPPQG